MTVAAAAVYACSPNVAHGAQSVTLHARFIPNQLGASTTLLFGFQVATATGQVPTPLTNINLSYPVHLGLATSGLGLATCDPAKLNAYGPDGCPINSRMGYGTALVEVPLGHSIIQETAQITLLAGQIQNGHLELLIHASGKAPIDAQIVFETLLLPAPAPFGGRLDTSIPLVPTVPSAPDVAVVQLHLAIGPLHLTYHQHVHGRDISYHPRGIILPKTCPQGGFPFQATFSFLDHSTTSSSTAIPCPTHMRRHL